MTGRSGNLKLCKQVELIATWYCADMAEIQTHAFVFVPPSLLFLTFSLALSFSTLSFRFDWAEFPLAALHGKTY